MINGMPVVFSVFHWDGKERHMSLYAAYLNDVLEVSQTIQDLKLLGNPNNDPEAWVRIEIVGDERVAMLDMNSVNWINRERIINPNEPNETAIDNMLTGDNQSGG
jgi:hypothetical protein